MRPSPSHSTAQPWFDRCYRLLLLAYPADFRRQCGAEMRQVFRARARADRATQSLLGAIVFWKGILMDWISSAVRERMSSGGASTLAAFVCAICFGLFAAYVDFQNDEVQAPVLAVLAGSFIVAVIQPRGAWRWPLIVALCLPLSRTLGPMFGVYPKLPATPNNFATLLALIPAFIGAYLGVVVRFAGRAILH